jgi:hypothetical protein
MHERCSHCGLHYEREPGYWYVAMFVSYAFNVAEMVTFAVGLHMLNGLKFALGICGSFNGGDIFAFAV